MQTEQTIFDYQTISHRLMSTAERRKLDIGDVWSNEGHCKDCGGYIRSKNRHHMAHCECGKSFIDGGSWYGRIGGKVDYHPILFRYIKKDLDD